MNAPTKAPKPVLKPGIVYLGDNGRAVCIHCAGNSALYTGRDLSGQKVLPMMAEELAIWKEMTSRKTLSCEKGCTVCK